MTRGFPNRNLNIQRSALATMLLAIVTIGTAGKGPPDGRMAKGNEQTRFIDLSLLVGQEYPCTWPTFPPFQINPYQRIGPLSAYNSDVLILDGNTGTQLDVPPHSVTPPDSGLSNAGRFGLAYTDKVPAWQFVGEACVIDCKDLFDTAPAGRSDLIKSAKIKAWEKRYRALGPGDVVLFHSGYSDKYYKPLPEGRRFAADPVEGKAPAWPGPDPECMTYLAGRMVLTLGTDSTSKGPLPDLSEPTHYAGLKHGMIWTEKHFTSSEAVRDIVIGMSDGLTVPFALAAGLSGAVEATSIIITAGLAEIAAGSIAMGLGGYLASKTDAEHFASEQAREERETVDVPEVEAEEVAKIFREQGLPEDTVATVVRAIRSDRKRWVDFMMKFELGLEPPDPNRARRSALTIALSYMAGGLVPLAPYFFIGSVHTALLASVGSTLLALFAFGYIKGQFTTAKPLRSAWQTVAVGGVAAGAAFLIAKAIG